MTDDRHTGPTARPSASPCGGQCTFRSTRRRTSSNDEIGLQLVAPDADWRTSGHGPSRTARVRASIVARARFIEDLVVEQSERGVGQYALLGAGLDTFAQRRPEIASRIRFSRSTSLGRRPGSNVGSSSSASMCPIGYGSSRSTSRPIRGGIDCWPTASTRPSPR